MQLDKGIAVMDTEAVTSFFMWCTILDGALLIFWTTMLILAPDLVYRTQYRFFPIPRDTFNVIIYVFLGTFKIVFLAFNLIPFVALMIVG